MVVNENEGELHDVAEIKLHEMIKSLTRGILDWYDIRTQPEWPTPLGYRVDLVGFSSQNGTGSPDWGIEVELSSALQKDLASLRSLGPSLTHAIIISENPATLSLRHLKIEDWPVSIFPSPGKSELFEDHVRRAVGATSNRYPLGRLEQIATRLETESERVVPEIETFVRENALSITEVEEFVFKTYVGRNVFPDRHFRENRHGAHDEPLSNSHEARVLEALGVISSWDNWTGVRWTSESAGSDKTYYFHLTEKGALVGRVYAERRIAANLERIRAIMSGPSRSFVRPVLVGTGGTLDLWRERLYPDMSDPLSITNWTEEGGLIESPFDPGYRLEIDAAERAMLRSLVSFRGLRPAIESLYTEFEKIGLAVRGFGITSKKHDRLDYISLPLEIFRPELFDGWREPLDWKSLRRFQAAAVVYHFIGTENSPRRAPPSLTDFTATVNHAGLQLDEVRDLLSELQRKRLVSKWIEGGPSPYAVLEVSQLRAECDQVMAQSASAFLGLMVPPGKAAS